MTLFAAMCTEPLWKKLRKVGPIPPNGLRGGGFFPIVSRAIIWNFVGARPSPFADSFRYTHTDGWTAAHRGFNLPSVTPEPLFCTFCLPMCGVHYRTDRKHVALWRFEPGSLSWDTLSTRPCTSHVSLEKVVFSKLKDFAKIKFVFFYSLLLS